MAKIDVYQEVTDKIIAALEAGIDDPWKLPWVQTGNGLPVNVNGRAYNGLNILLLWCQTQTNGFSSNVWATFKQWQDAGGQVRKGEKSSLVTFWKELTIEDDTAENGETRLPMIRHYRVFNADQVDGYVAEKLDLPDLAERIDAAEAFVAKTGAKVIYSGGGSQAFYQPATDEIHMPALAAFLDTEDATATENHYGTLLHELTHWTLPKDRCDRLGEAFSGLAGRAAEELVAELGSAFLCAQLGISPEPRADHAKYIQSWLKALRGDKKAISKAAAAANRAVQFLNELQDDNQSVAA